MLEPETKPCEAQASLQTSATPPACQRPSDTSGDRAMKFLRCLHRPPLLKNLAQSVILVLEAYDITAPPADDEFIYLRYRSKAAWPELTASYAWSNNQSDIVKDGRKPCPRSADTDNALQGTVEALTEALARLRLLHRT